MKIISSRTHGVLDYIVGLVLILSPRLFNLDASSAEGQVPVALGIATLIYSVLTRYEVGLIKVIPFRVHLTLDTLSGILLALSPWLFGFAERRWGTHLVLGFLELGAVMMTRRDTTLMGHDHGFDSTHHPRGATGGR
jgi:hypothetical protein